MPENFNKDYIENSLPDNTDLTIQIVKKAWNDSYKYRELKYLQKGLELMSTLKILQSHLCPELVNLIFKHN